MEYWSISDPDESWLQRLRLYLDRQRYPVMLESSGSEVRFAKYSLYGCDPSALLRYDGNEISATGLSLSAASKADPFKALEQLQQHMYQEDPCTENTSGFSSAIIGYLSYDLGRTIESLPTTAENDIPLPAMVMGYYALLFVHHHQTKRMVLVGAPNQALRAATLIKAIKALSIHSLHFTLASPWHSNMTREEYLHRFDRVKDYILEGDCYQVNLAQRWRARYAGSPLAAYNRLREGNRAPFSAYLGGRTLADESFNILSVSPERFIAVQGDHCETRPIKGTRPRRKNRRDDAETVRALQSSTKDQAENVMIVDLLRNDFSKVCRPHSVRVPELFQVESYAAVHHLVSSVEGRLRPELANTDLLKACFPGGSITGAPKIRAMEIIETLEPHRRQIYCGSMGYLANNGDMDTNIAIRTLVSYREHLYCWAGGGLVADSIGGSEYQETLDKVAHILPLLENIADVR